MNEVGFIFSNNDSVLETKKLNCFASSTKLLDNINISFKKNAVTAIIGPSGSGKSMLAKCFNRLNDLNPLINTSGQIFFKNDDISNGYDVYLLRQKIGMVFQKPVIFPKSIRENILFGLRGIKKTNKTLDDYSVEEVLQSVMLWDEIKDRLHDSAKSLSLGQQQRLCISRTLMMEPEIIILDEPTASLDPKSTIAIERMITQFKKKHTVIIITHDLRQAQRIADYVIFICNGQICETGEVKNFFSNPCMEKTREYIQVC